MYNKNHKKIYYDKIFPKKNGVDLHSLLIDYEAVSFITTPRDSIRICNVIEKEISKYNKNL